MDKENSDVNSQSSSSDSLPVVEGKSAGATQDLHLSLEATPSQRDDDLFASYEEDDVQVLELEISDKSGTKDTSCIVLDDSKESSSAPLFPNPDAVSAKRLLHASSTEDDSLVKKPKLDEAETSQEASFTLIKDKGSSGVSADDEATAVSQDVHSRPGSSLMVMADSPDISVSPISNVKEVFSDNLRQRLLQRRTSTPGRGKF